MIDEQEREMDDPVKEIRKIRDSHAKQFRNNLAAMFEDIELFAKEQNLRMVTASIKPNDKKTGS